MQILFDYKELLPKYSGNLTARELIRLGQELGWREAKRRGKGSHRCLVREGYEPVVITCHGLGHELGKGLTRKLVNQIVEPFLAVNELLPNQIIAQFESWIAAEHTQFQQAAELALQELAQEAKSRLVAIEEACLAEAEAVAAQMRHETETHLAQQQHRFSAWTEQQRANIQAANRSIQEQQQQMETARQSMAEWQHSLKAQELALKSQSQRVMDFQVNEGQHQERIQKVVWRCQRHKRLTLVGAIAAAVVAGMPVAPNWFKTITVLMVPAIAQVGANDQR